MLKSVSHLFERLAERCLALAAGLLASKIEAACIRHEAEQLLTAVENGGAGEVLRRSKMVARYGAALRGAEDRGVSPYLAQSRREAQECDPTWSSGRMSDGKC